MLRHTIRNANPVITASIEKILEEERRFERTERRSSVREPISRPVIIQIMKEGEGDEISAFTNNISVEGIGLISNVDFKQGTKAKIEIYSTTGISPVIISELRWSKPFGKDWFASGWHFVTAVKS